MIPAALFALALASSTACGNDDSGSGNTGVGGATGTPGTGTGTGNGTTPCGGQTCSAGQHCDNLLCQDGCLADTNCASNQTCVKAGGVNTGSCQNNTVTPPPTGGVTLEAFCKKAKACRPVTTDAECKQIFDGTNETCHVCVVGSNCGGSDACRTECRGS